MDSSPPKIFIFKSPFGALTLRTQENQSDAWFLSYEEFKTSDSGHTSAGTNVITSGWRTPEAAAQAVFERRTGWSLWDALPYVVYPSCLEDWQEVQGYGYTPLKDSESE